MKNYLFIQKKIFMYIFKARTSNLIFKKHMEVALGPYNISWDHLLKTACLISVNDLNAMHPNSKKVVYLKTVALL